MGKVELVIFKGVRFRRYPDAKNAADRRYFTPGIADKMRGVRRLHEEVWMHANGVDTVPEGHHIHHIDHDIDNNDPSNLEAIPASEHFRHHASQPRSQAQIEHRERNMPNFIEKAREWHASPEGLEHHRQNGRIVWENAEYRDETCEQCGDTFSTRCKQRNYARFCSNKCKSAWRRDAGIDDVDRDCEYCGETFRISKYSKTRTCGRLCGSRIQWANRRAA